LDLKDIKAIIDLMKKNSIGEFELERQDFKIRLKRGMTGPVVIAEEAQSPTVLSVGPAPLSLPTTAAAAASPNGAAEIKSPMIGTLYRAPSPDAGNYVEIGSEVGPDTVVCLIEAMKVMNEIKAEQRGVITEILSENAKPVEFGQPLFKIRPL
jgi:acetyl-CoA carboxylase biotin carboxyl carrier protein